MVAQFRDERSWSKFHTPRNVCLAITSEFGELAEVLQFHDDEESEISMVEYDSLMKEMADVAIYAIALSDALPPDETGVPFVTRILQQIKQSSNQN
jgi:dCTP diphosphatase